MTKIQDKLFIHDICFQKINELEGEKIGFLDKKNQIVYVSPACFSLIQTDRDLMMNTLKLIEIIKQDHQEFLEWYIAIKSEYLKYRKEADGKV